MKEKLNCRKQALFHITKVLWHLDIFRRSFRELSGHACMAESCIFCALKELFGQLQFSQESALPPDALRRALAESFFDQQRFQLGFMDDAAECFENILLRIHYHIASNEVEDMCNARHCIPHQKFAMTLVEQSVCEACHVTSEPLSYTQMVHYVSASALTTQARQAGKSAHPDFGQLLRKAGGMGDIRDCPSSCGAKIQICRSLMNRPEIVSVGVVWDSERPTLQHIMAVFATIGTSLRLSDVFHSVMDHRWAATTTHALVGVVTYYGKHYSTFFFHTKLRVWIYFDDATVREIGPRFEQVVEKCRRGRYQPLLLLYAVQGGTPVATDSAPKTIVQIPVNRDAMKARTTAKTSSPSLPRSSAMPGSLSNGQTVTLPPLHCSVAPTTSPSLPLRRSVTPSPEKTQSAPNSTSPRRAITPNPDVAHHRTISRSYSDYQNLTDIQASIFGNGESGEPGYISRKAVESVLSYQKQNPVQRANSIYSKEGDKKVSLQRTSSVYSDGIAMPEHMNVPRRRDSGNWSGDRNSASSSSSMENPYLYLVGKLQARNQAVPRSPTSTKPPGDVFLDPGYDSYSLSSNDSLPLQQGLKHNLQLAQIPEHLPPSTCVYPARLAGDECEHLCLEADQLLDKSKQLEEARDLETALVLCQAAAGKARAAMDAPYNNPQTLTFARMKHNTCVMRVRSLHRRLLQAQAEAMGEISKDDGLKISHSREGSGSSNRSGGHSRQGSRDKTSSGQHSRQSSRELANQLPVVTTEKPTKNIEIYATLPKKKLGGSLRGPKNKSSVEFTIEDEEYMYDRPGRSLYSRGGKKKEEEKNMKEKRARSEERNKSTRDYLSGNVGLTLPKDSSLNKKESQGKKEKEKAKAKEKEEAAKTDKATGEVKQGKKQHKIRRKLLLGGLIRRKNRSMPDLREGNGIAPEEGEPSVEMKASQDDSILSVKGGEKMLLSGYLSEGHLEYAGNANPNPNLERSRLMRKSFHGSAGKVLHAAKVPPPPPLRTTSQLTNKDERPPYPLPNDMSYQSSHNPILHRLASTSHNPMVNEALFIAYNNYNHVEPQSLPYMPTYNDGKSYEPVQYANGGVLLERLQNNSMVQNQNFQNDQGQHPYNNTLESVRSADEILSTDGSLQNLALPPYPSPPTSVNHSRQASEDFPLPPPPLEHLLQQSPAHQHSPTPSLIAAAQESPNSLLAQLQQKRQQILDKDGGKRDPEAEGSKQKTGEEWLKELQAKQAERKLKKSQGSSVETSNTNNVSSADASKENLSSVKDLASRFENIRVHPVPKVQNCESETRKNMTTNSHSPLTVPSATNERVASVPLTEHLPVSNSSALNNSVSCVNNNYESSTNRANVCSTNSQDNLFEASCDNSVLVKKLTSSTTSLDYLSNNGKIISENTESSASIQNLLDSKSDVVDGKRKSGKKKNVTFCDQVILVATAEDEEDDSFIPNPILERVLRSAFKHDGSRSTQQEAKITTVPLSKPMEHTPRALQTQNGNTSLERENSSYPNPPLDTRLNHKHDQEAAQDSQVQYKQAEQDPGGQQAQYQPQSYRLDRQLQETYLNSNLRPISYQANPPSSQLKHPPNAQTNYYQPPNGQMSQSQNPQPSVNYYQTSPSTAPTQSLPQSQPNYYQQTPTQQLQSSTQSQPNYYQQNSPQQQQQLPQNPSQGQPNYYQQTPQQQQLQGSPQPQPNYYQSSPQQQPQTPPQAPLPNYYQQSQQQPIQHPPQPQTNYYQQNPQVHQTQNPQMHQTQNPHPSQNPPPPQSSANYYPSQPHQLQASVQGGYYQQTLPQGQNTPPSQANYYQPSQQQQHYPASDPQRQQQHHEYQQQGHALQQHAAFSNHQALPANAQPVYQRVPHPAAGVPSSHEAAQRTQNHVGHPDIMQRAANAQENVGQRLGGVEQHRAPNQQPVSNQHHLNHQEMLHRQASGTKMNQRLPNTQDMMMQRQMNHPPNVSHQMNGQRPLSHQDLAHRQAVHQQNIAQQNMLNQEMQRHTNMVRQGSQDGAGAQRTSAQESGPQRQQHAYPPYQHPPPPRQVSATRAVYQPLPEDAVRATPCNLCHKKPVVSPAIYCNDCNFYMSRFKPKA